MGTESDPQLAGIVYEGLVTDADLAITSLDLIFAGDPPEGVERVVRNASAVYHEIVARRATISLSPEQARLLEEKLDRLRSRLTYWKAVA